ncbi:hypothetical protein HPB48_009759 [Haemaphysalis longicornis]|uniref:Uncharacterized protein n=1 Tax=Haemaphysalis longicornis TaxID=44386 RepID=A0A9J6GN97_HAELO|nr:hypothetical protein HPB48_009759 [Haemaphysalis longicornis]
MRPCECESRGAEVKRRPASEHTDREAAKRREREVVNLTRCHSPPREGAADARRVATIGAFAQITTPPPLPPLVDGTRDRFSASVAAITQADAGPGATCVRGSLLESPA